VVVEHEYTIERAADVDLDVVAAEQGGLLEGFEGVLGHVLVGSAVTDEVDVLGRAGERCGCENEYQQQDSTGEDHHGVVDQEFAESGFGIGPVVPHEASMAAGQDANVNKQS